MANEKVLKVLVIDDSAYNRRALGEMLDGIAGVEVVGKAQDGEEGLRLAHTLQPDLITLDLEMPRMDGFTFLRIQMSRQRIPVFVVSAHASRENIFRALELGAVDFVAKPTRRISPQIMEIRDELARKVEMARNLKPSSLPPPQPWSRESLRPSPTEGVKTPERVPMDWADGEEPAARVVVIAASTGGPAALSRLVAALPQDFDAGVVVAQHMPPRFTTTFAERLDRLGPLTVMEATGVSSLRRGLVLVAPGDRCVELARGGEGFIVREVEPSIHDRYVPSADRLFRSAAAAAGRNVLAVVLTGMGDDGAEGAMFVAGAGGRVVVESEETAVIAGMPSATVRTGVVEQVEPIHRLAGLISEFGRPQPPSLGDGPA
ncbi:MAG: chemotaxis-specific protein-glutamate methyltransferase CheB [Deltaproteobacteria bacterium]|nr:chemotaxis-specific protein-glutamate methyltransferase CheB [Deltaproteobacteria bacterium]